MTIDSAQIKEKKMPDYILHPMNFSKNKNRVETIASVTVTK